MITKTENSIVEDGGLICENGILQLQERKGSLHLTGKHDSVSPLAPPEESLASIHKTAANFLSMETSRHQTYFLTPTATVASPTPVSPLS